MKILAVILCLFICGCAGYIEKHLKIQGTNVRCPYGSGNVTVTRDVFIGWGNKTPEKQGGV